MRPDRQQDIDRGPRVASREPWSAISDLIVALLAGWLAWRLGNAVGSGQLAGADIGATGSPGDRWAALIPGLWPLAFGALAIGATSGAIVHGLPRMPERWRSAVGLAAQWGVVLAAGAYATGVLQTWLPPVLTGLGVHGATAARVGAVSSAASVLGTAGALAWTTRRDGFLPALLASSAAVAVTCVVGFLAAAQGSMGGWWLAAGSTLAITGSGLQRLPRRTFGREMGNVLYHVAGSVSLWLLHRAVLLGF